MKKSYSTSRLTIEPYTNTQLPCLFELYRDELCMRFIPPTQQAETIEQLDSKYRKIEKNPSNHLFSIYRKGQDDVIGEACLFLISEQGQSEYELGYILSPLVWGHGFGTELCEALISICFQEHKASLVQAHMYKENLGSIRVVKKCGMTLRNEERSDRRSDVLLFSMQKAKCND